MFRRNERRFDRSEDNLRDLGIHLPFDQYYTQWVSRFNSHIEVEQETPSEVNCCPEVSRRYWYDLCGETERLNYFDGGSWDIVDFQ